MEGKIYRAACDFSDGKTTIRKGEYVMATKQRGVKTALVTTLDGKRKIAEVQKTDLRSCKLTLKDKELFHMQLLTGGWHDYYCIGTNPYEMWKRLIQVFNYDQGYGTNYNTHTIQKYEFFCDFYIPLCKIKNCECFASSTDTDVNRTNKGQFEEIGNYKEMYYGKE